MKTAGDLDRQLDSFVDLIEGLEDLLNQNNLSVIDKALSSVDYSRISPEAMIAFVRVTYQARFKLPAWPNALRTIEDELTRRGFDGPQMLAMDEYDDVRWRQP